MRAILIFCFILPSVVLSQQDYKYSCKPFWSETCCKYFLTYSGTEQCNDLSGWVMTFEDNFDGDSLDMGKWKYPYQGVMAGYDFESSKTWYANTGTTPSRPVSNNVKVENGKLKLIAKKESTPINGSYVTNWGTNPPTTSSSSFNYSSGWVESKKNFGYGWYEISCKIPKGKGMWPAFWLVAGEGNYTYEIDIFEFWNEDNCSGNYDESKLSRNPHQNVLSDKVNFPQTAKCPTDLYACGANGPVDYSANFHTFALEWDFFKLVWYIDGNVVRTAYRYKDYTTGLDLVCNSVPIESGVRMAKFWPQIDNMGVIFNLGVQQNHGNEPDASTTFPKEYEIEYFRFYKKGSCVAERIYTEEGWSWNTLVNSVRYATMLAQNITISGSVSPVVLESTEQLDVVATNSIVLDPGYEVKNGANFTAFIDPGYCDINAMAVNNEYQENVQDKYDSELNVALDLETFSDLDLLKVYPNPASDGLTIELISNSGGLSQIEITDNQGRSLLSDSKELNEPMNLDVSTFSPGTYFIKILNKQTGKVYLERFTKNK